MEIAITDTNLQQSWVKYIASGNGVCIRAGSITACNNRTGVLVTGLRTSILSTTDTSLPRAFIYRIDTGTRLGIGDPHAPITIRNRIVAYPNPTLDNLTIDDILGHLTMATLTNMQGQLIYQGNVSGNTTVVHMQDYAPGLYLLRVKTSDGELYSEKISIQR